MRTAPVGSFAPNAFGLYDMHGNVFKWVEDCSNASREAPTDRSPWVTNNCSVRMVRGGSWSDDPQVLRSAHRDWDTPNDRDFHLGFRLARSLHP